MINSVTLSTGKSVQIPIFTVPPANDFEQVTRGYVALRSYGTAASVVYSPYTDAELLELYVILTGQTVTATTITPPDPSSIGMGEEYPILIGWVYFPYDNKYHLEIGLTGTGNSVGIQGALFGKLGYCYYNGWNKDQHTYPAYPYNDYYEAKAEDPEPPQYLMNLRPGSPYSLDLYGKGSYTLYYFGQRFGDESTVRANIEAYIAEHPDEDIDYDESDNPYVNPYGVVISEPGGGDGDIDLDPDEIDKAEIPDLPTISAVDAGLITMYNCTAGQLQVLGNYLWSNAYDLETNFTKLFASPMEAIIGLSIIPVTPTLGGASTVKFGNIDTHISMSKLASQFVEKDMGTISVKKWIGSFMDYSPYVKLSLYLPYVGYREIDPDDVVGDTIHVVYHIDCLSGGCCAMVETGKKGLLYSFDGSCIANVPITALNYSGAIQNAISAVSGGVSTVAGLATGNPVAAIGGAASVAQNVTNIKPSIQRSGQMSGAAGLMSYQSPMLIIERPNMCVPENLNTYTGNMLYVSRKLSQCKGFTQVSLIHLDGIPCTEKERDELMSLLNKGVIF